MRLAPRSFKVASAESSRAKRSNTRILILGAGVAGSSLVHEFQQNGYRFGNPVVLVDDDPEKIGRSINGTPIEGGCDRLTQIAQKYNADEIIFCIKNADEKRKRELLEVAVSTGCKVKIVPDINNLPDGGKANYKEIRNVDILDLLSRPEIKLDPETCKYLTGETVLVTGGGGSIGSELCRQIAKYAPKKIIIFDIYENNAYTLKQALDRHYFGSPEIIIRIGSVRDKARLREVFEEFHPSSVFHAAAHKHVPLMEDSPFEAIKNNTLGTYNTAECANEYKVSHFVLLSTDKAVNPTNVMGATKRTCELIIQHFAKISKGTTFAAVRFGNGFANRQTQAKAIGLGGEKRFEQPPLRFEIQAIAMVAHCQRQSGAITLQADNNRHLLTTRRLLGVTGVFQQVEQHLLNLQGVGQYLCLGRLGAALPGDGRRVRQHAAKQAE